MNRLLLIACWICSLLTAGSSASAQWSRISGRLTGIEEHIPDYGTAVIRELNRTTPVDESGRFVFERVPHGTYTIAVVALQIEPAEMLLVADASDVTVEIPVRMSSRTELDPIEILAEQERTFGIERLQNIQNFTLFEAKKNEVILLRNLTANTATNNARQLFGGITGLNIWESDGAGLQLGIGGRGLNPNRTSNFNTRQNGYDISADALGYPESYYTPPAEALERIEVIRGAASLQYGTQFGGMVNFIFKRPEASRRIRYVGRHTYGSWNFLNSFNSLSGTSRNRKFSYYTYFQRKQGEGWRPNSAFELNNGFTQLNWQISAAHRISLEYTHMDYVAQQPGGLTDALFERNPQASLRSRNWFSVDWNLLALNYTYSRNERTQFNARVFALKARRQSLGNLERINVIDFNQNRTLIDGQFDNMAAELRMVRRYSLGGRQQAFLTGVRLYKGHTRAMQGDADATSEPNFAFLHPSNVEGSDYRFPNYNASWFIEHIFRLTDRLTIVPGLRAEYIRTESSGYYRQRVFDFAGNVVADSRVYEELNRERNFVIAGMGVNYTVSPSLKLYANFSQNYRAINFTDLRIQNPNFRIDPDLRDERGYTADLGVRGNRKNLLSYEVTAFYLYYDNRIGQVLRSGQAPLYIDFRYRTNVSASRNIGLEAFGSLNVARLFGGLSKELDWSVFVNTAVISARYINSDEPGIEGNEVEMVPPVIVRTGTSMRYRRWGWSYQFSYTHEHYSDATNAVRTATAVEGLIPGYSVSDLSFSFEIIPAMRLEASCNNLTDARYFTRRAESYPGPGIIPSDARSLFVTLQVTL
jgi:Fe(3+) dicitrate transport protein